MPQPSSRLVLPVSRRVFWLRTGMVLLLDAALAAAGIWFFLKYQDRRAAASKPAVIATADKKDPERPSVVEVEVPKVVKKGKKKTSDLRLQTSDPGPRTATPANPSPKPANPNPSNPNPNPTNPSPNLVPDAAPAAVVVAPPVVDAGAVAVVPPVGVVDAGASGPVEDPEADERAERIADLIRDTMREGRDQIDKCYERAAKVDTQGLAGTIEVSLTILPSGATDGVRVVENDTGSEELGVCLAALLRSWRFPSPGGEAIEFLWPFVFRGR